MHAFKSCRSFLEIARGVAVHTTRWQGWFVIAGFLLCFASAGAETRTWTDRTGKFSTEAAFVDLTDGVVRLKKPNGTEIKVNLDVLSEEDRRYLLAQSNRRETQQRGSECRLPADFTFLALTRVQQEADLASLVKDFECDCEQSAGQMECVLRSGKEPDDAVSGLRGKGLRVALLIERQEPGTGGVRVPLMWDPEPFSCYRDGQLLGIWDPKTKILRDAETGEADKEIYRREFFQDTASGVNTSSGSQRPGIVGRPRVVKYLPLGPVSIRDFFGLRPEEGRREIRPKAQNQFAVVEIAVDGKQTLAAKEYLAVDGKGVSHTPLGVAFGGNESQFIDLSRLADQVVLTSGGDKVRIEEAMISAWELARPGLAILYEVPVASRISSLKYGDGQYLTNPVATQQQNAPIDLEARDNRLGESEIESSKKPPFTLTRGCDLPPAGWEMLVPKGTKFAGAGGGIWAEAEYLLLRRKRQTQWSCRVVPEARQTLRLPVDLWQQGLLATGMTSELENRRDLVFTGPVLSRFELTVTRAGDVNYKIAGGGPQKGIALKWEQQSYRVLCEN